MKIENQAITITMVRRVLLVVSLLIAMAVLLPMMGMVGTKKVEAKTDIVGNVGDDTTTNELLINTDTTIASMREVFIQAEAFYTEEVDCGTADITLTWGTDNSQDQLIVSTEHPWSLFANDASQRCLANFTIDIPTDTETILAVTL